MFLPMDAHGWIPALSSRCFSPQIPVDGAWGPWAPWSACSRSCGGGVSSSHRFCSRPAPLNGGRFCRGERLRFRSCKAQDCPGRSGEWRRAAGRSAELRAARGPSRVPFAPPAPAAFREEQCAAYNHRVVSAALPAVADWEPRYGGVAEEDRCKLTCQSRSLGVYHVLRPRVSFPPSGPFRPAVPLRADAAPCRRSRTGRRARRRAAAFASGAAASPPAATASSAPRRSSTNACGAAATAPAAPRCPAPSPRPGERAGRGGTHGCAGRLRPRRSPRCSFQPSSQLPPPPSLLLSPAIPPAGSAIPSPSPLLAPVSPPSPPPRFPTLPSPLSPPPPPRPLSRFCHLLHHPSRPRSPLQHPLHLPFRPICPLHHHRNPTIPSTAPPSSSLPLRPLSTHLSPPFPLLAPHPPSNPHPQLF